MRTENRLRGILRAVGGATLATTVMASPAMAQGSDAGDVGSLPITEVTAFKDGHALVVRSGAVPTNGAGDVVLRELPRAVLGTFWTDEFEAGAELRAVVAQTVELSETADAASMAELLAQNIGARIEFKDNWSVQRHGTLRRILNESGQQIAVIDETMGGPGGGGGPSGDGSGELDHPGTRIAAIPLNEMRDLRFVGKSPTTSLERAAFENRLTLDLEWEGTAAEEAEVSIMAVEDGLRWIPAYRVTMLENDRVLIELEATLVNDLADLANARVHMAVGVPSFAFAGEADPMAMAEAMAQLGQAYERRRDGRSAGGMLSNSIMSQVASYDASGFAGVRENEALSGGTTPEAGGSSQSEDLYVFTIEHLTLDRGARMVLPLASYECDAESVYTLDLIAAPPMQAMGNFNTQQQRELAMRLDRPVARHVLRISNENELGMPITTAPALVMKDGRTLAQGLLRYASAGAKADLQVGAAMDLTVTADENEVGRDPNALNWGGNGFGRIDIGFTGCVTNRKDRAITIEISKLALGLSDSVSQGGEAGGEANAINLMSDSTFWAGSTWGSNFSWPWWWHGVNGATRYEWTLEIAPGESAEFGASWHYFWD